MVSDLAVGSAAILLAVLGRFGASEPLGPGAAYLVLLIGGPVVWLTLLLATGVYNPRRLASGAAEFGRIIDAGLWMLAAIVGASYLTRSDLSREVAAVTVTSLTLFTLAVHLVGRLLLQRRLRVGGALHRVLVVGSGPEAERLVDHIARLPHTGLRVVGVCPVKDPELPIGAPPATSPTTCSARRSPPRVWAAWRRWRRSADWPSKRRRAPQQSEAGAKPAIGSGKRRPTRPGQR